MSWAPLGEGNERAKKETLDWIGDGLPSRFSPGSFQLKGPPLSLSLSAANSMQINFLRWKNSPWFFQFEKGCFILGKLTGVTCLEGSFLVYLGSLSFFLLLWSLLVLVLVVLHRRRRGQNFKLSPLPTTTRGRRARLGTKVEEVGTLFSSFQRQTSYAFLLIRVWSCLARCFFCVLVIKFSLGKF